MSAAMVSTMGAEAMGGVVRFLGENTIPEKDATAIRTQLIQLADLTTSPVPMNRWMKYHDDKLVDTLQFRVDPGSQEVRGIWSPPRRFIDATRATRVVFLDAARSTSERMYAGVRAIRSSEDAWVGYDVQWHTLLVYTVVR